MDCIAHGVAKSQIQLSNLQKKKKKKTAKLAKRRQSPKWYFLPFSLLWTTYLDVYLPQENSHFLVYESSFHTLYTIVRII